MRSSHTMSRWVLATVLALGLGLAAGCSDTVRDSQTSQFRSIESLTDQLFKMKILTKSDRLLVVRMPFPVRVALGRRSASGQAEQLFFDDALVAGLLKNGAVVLQDMDVGESPEQVAVDQAVARLMPLPGRQATNDLLPQLLSVAGKLPQAGKLLEIGGRCIPLGKIGSTLTDLGITKVLLYRWVYHSRQANIEPEGNSSFDGNRVFVRVVDASTGYIIWSDLLVSRQQSAY